MLDSASDACASVANGVGTPVMSYAVVQAPSHAATPASSHDVIPASSYTVASIFSHDFLSKCVKCSTLVETVLNFFTPWSTTVLHYVNLFISGDICHWLERQSC